MMIIPHEFLLFSVMSLKRQHLGNFVSSNAVRKRTLDRAGHLRYF